VDGERGTATFNVNSLEQLLELLDMVTFDELPASAREHLQRLTQSMRLTKEALTELGHALLLGLVLGDGSVPDKWQVTYA